MTTPSTTTKAQGIRYKQNEGHKKQNTRNIPQQNTMRTTTRTAKKLVKLRSEPILSNITKDAYRCRCGDLSKLYEFVQLLVSASLEMSLTRPVFDRRYRSSMCERWPRDTKNACTGRGGDHDMLHVHLPSLDSCHPFHTWWRSNNRIVFRTS